MRCVEMCIKTSNMKHVVELTIFCHNNSSTIFLSTIISKIFFFLVISPFGEIHRRDVKKPFAELRRLTGANRALQMFLKSPSSHHASSRHFLSCCTRWMKMELNKDSVACYLRLEIFILIHMIHI